MISSSSVAKEASAEPLGTGTLIEQSEFKESLGLTQHPQNLFALTTAAWTLTP